MEKVEYHDGDKSFFENIQDKVILGLTEFLWIINPRGPLGKIAIKGIKKQLLYEELKNQYYEHFKRFFNNAKNWKIEFEDENDKNLFFTNIKNLLKQTRKIEENIGNTLQHIYYECDILNNTVCQNAKCYHEDEQKNEISKFFERYVKIVNTIQKNHRNTKNKR